MNTFPGTNPDELGHDWIDVERRREREFYKYYEPICTLSSEQPIRVNLFDENAARNHIARSSPDTSLTAFCQLGALRLQTRRCLLFFFDVNNAYVLAEATRSLSLVDDGVHDENDALWLGNSVIPRGLAVCEHTVNIHIANNSSNKDHENAHLVHIINNLKEDTRFCDRPFVTDGPNARFYAGVPIITPSGQRIGAYCVLDDKPRDGLNDKDVQFLVQMGKTIMNHIETVRSRADFQRGSRMLTSMENFFNSTPVVAASRKTSGTPINPLPQAEADLAPVVTDGDREYFNKDLKTTEDTIKTPKIHSGSDGSPSPMMSSVVGTRTTSPGEGPMISSKADELDQIFEHNVRSTFQTAATLIRTASDVDGIIFLEMASPTTHDSSSSAKRKIRGREIDSDPTQSMTDGASTDGRSTDSEEDATNFNPCPVLGASVNSNGLSDVAQAHAVPSKFVRSLLRRYPRGKIWYFDGEGDSSIGDSSSSEHTEHRERPRIEGRSVSVQQRRCRAQESTELQRLFPGVRALGLISVYDQGKNRLYAGGFMWTYSPVRILTAEADLGYLRAFSDVIMANVSRLQARMDDQAKTSFISSISHELRSPLHGILGSIDFLQDQAVMDWSIVAQIEKCSITLMDVIEHLLEYAKINNFSHAQKSKRKGRTWLDNNAAAQRHGRLQPITELTEEIADAVFYSHCCNMDVKEHSNVAFILDIESEHLQSFKVPVGGWKRLCINIINNALKYTSKGHVSVSLKAVQRPRKRPVAELTVTDTGRGMSRDFLEHGLFKAFSQEDSLATGTGLGMSLVAKLVRSVHGKIEVQSTKDVGTTVKISVPLDAKDWSSQMPTSTGLSVKLPVPATTTIDPIKHNDEVLQSTALERACNAIGVAVVEYDADIILLKEQELAKSLIDEDFKRSIAGKPIVLLCTSFASAATMRQSALAKALECHIEYIAQPYGPERLAQAFKRCRPSGLSDLLDPPISKNDQVSREQESLSTTPIVLRRGSGDMRSPRPLSQRSSVLHASRAKSVEGKIVKDDAARKEPASLPPPPTASATTSMTSLPAPGLSSLAEHGSAGRPPLSLLIVDDNPINVRILMTYADRHRHPRLSASDGGEAVQAYQATVLDPDMHGAAALRAPRPDVIFMDINMPVMDGFEASRRIRAFEKSHSLTPATIIALTGLGSDDARQQALAVGIDIFLTKPIRPRDLKPLLVSVEQSRRSLESPSIQ